MSLVGNLEDLSLGDILQIISLAQKSGVLALSGELGTGRIVFRSGLVQAACLKGGPNALRDLLVHHACIDPAGYDAAHFLAESSGVPIEEMLNREEGLSQERIDELITKSAESAVFEMFTWPSGDFSFDVRNELDPEDPQLILPNGINAQYLAMEGARIRDERDRDDGAAFVDPNAETDPNIGVAEDPLFGSEPCYSPEAECLDEALPFLDFEPVEADSEASPAVLEEAIEDPQAILAEAEEQPQPTAADTLVARVVERADATDDLTFEDSAAGMRLETLPEVSLDSAPVIDARKMPVVLIDPDVTVLEWVKAAIEGDFARVHVFQQADQGLSRIRQYLIRGETPLVLLSPEIQIDPLSGIHGLADFVKRLKAQSQRLVVLGLRDDEDAAPPATPGMLNGVLRRPAKRMLAKKHCPEGEIASQALSRALLEILAPQGPSSARKNAETEADSLRELRDTTEKPQDASSRSENMPVVWGSPRRSFRGP